MDRQDRFSGLEFKQDRALDDDVGSVATVQVDRLIADRKGHLAVILQTSEGQLVTKASFIGRF
jgi:hypothetical protein